MLIQNGVVFTDEGRFTGADVLFENERIVEVGPVGSLSASEVIDAEGGFVLPGFVDIHSHGALGHDFCDAEPDGIEKMLQYYGSQGITSVVPATMSFNEPILSEVIDVAMPFMEEGGNGAVLRGINMEGPFINKGKKGAQNDKYIVDPQIAMFEALYKRAEGYIKLVDLAPELPGSLDFIKAVSGKCVLSIAHTDANYDQAMAAFEAGASHVTHLFNAMPPFGHRAPGVVGAASDAAAHVEIISDGIHLHPAVVRAVFRWFGPQRVCLVSDSMRATGMPNGEYSLGGQKVLMSDGKATLEDGTIAGSAVNLAECCRRAAGFEVPLEQAVMAATINPAKAIGIDHIVGSITPGKRADMVLWNRALHTTMVISGGQIIFN